MPCLATKKLREYERIESHGMNVNNKARENQIPWNEVQCALWFANFNSYSENLDRQKYFELLLVILILALMPCLKFKLSLPWTKSYFSQLKLIIDRINRSWYAFYIACFAIDRINHSLNRDRNWESLDWQAFMC